MISEKSITMCTFIPTERVSQPGIKKCLPEFSILSALKLRSCELLVFIDMNTYILIEDKDFWAFLKKNYAVALDSCYMFTNNKLNMELDMMLIVLVEFAYIVNRFTLTPPTSVIAKIP